MQITSITKPKATFENTSDLSATLVSRILPEKMPSGLVVDDIEIDAKALAVINKSPDRVDLAFEVEGSDIGKVTRDAIAKELQLNGPFRSLNEVERRVDGFGPGKLEVTRKVAESDALIPMLDDVLDRQQSAYVTLAQVAADVGAILVRTELNETAQSLLDVASAFEDLSQDFPILNGVAEEFRNNAQSVVEKSAAPGFDLARFAFEVPENFSTSDFGPSDAEMVDTGRKLSDASARIGLGLFELEQRLRDCMPTSSANAAVLASSGATVLTFREGLLLEQAPWFLGCASKQLGEAFLEFAVWLEALAPAIGLMLTSFEAVNECPTLGKRTCKAGDVRLLYLLRNDRPATSLDDLIDLGEILQFASESSLSVISATLTVEVKKLLASQKSAFSFSKLLADPAAYVAGIRTLFQKAVTSLASKGPQAGIVIQQAVWADILGEGLVMLATQLQKQARNPKFFRLSAICVEVEYTECVEGGLFSSGNELLKGKKNVRLRTLDFDGTPVGQRTAFTDIDTSAIVPGLTVAQIVAGQSRRGAIEKSKKELNKPKIDKSTEDFYRALQEKFEKQAKELDKKYDQFVKIAQTAACNRIMTAPSISAVLTCR